MALSSFGANWGKKLQSCLSVYIKGKQKSVTLAWNKFLQAILLKSIKIPLFVNFTEIYQNPFFFVNLQVVIN